VRESKDDLKSQLMSAGAYVDSLEDELTVAQENLADACDLSYWALVQCTRPGRRVRRAEFIEGLKDRLENLPSKLRIVGAMQERDAKNGEVLKHAQIDLDSSTLEAHEGRTKDPEHGSSASYLQTTRRLA
jgi:hypothetical protein